MFAFAPGEEPRAKTVKSSHCTMANLALIGAMLAAIDRERDALRALYESANGESWRLDGWLGGGSVCKWSGVECDAHGQVKQLDLGGNKNVRGTMPASLGHLTALRFLRLDEARLSGTCPGTLGQLVHLVELFGNANRLSGTLPVQLGRLSSLRVLESSANSLSGTIPAALGGLTSLQRLHLDHTRLSGTAPPQLGRLGHLEALWLHENAGISGTLPTQYGRLGALSLGFSLASTRLSGTLPSQIAALGALQHLWITSTHLSGTLPHLLPPRLEGLELHANSLSGTLPRSLSGLHSLRRCVLIRAQGPLQVKHAHRPEDPLNVPDSNTFACPLPDGIPGACQTGLRCGAHARKLALVRGSGRRGGGRRGGGRGRARGMARGRRHDTT